MTKFRTHKIRTITIASIILALIAFFIIRGAWETASLYDYALSLGSDELFAGEDYKLYRMAPPARQLKEDQIFLHYENPIENIEFPRFFGKKPLHKLSPYEFAATYSDSELYIQGDGSIWTVAPGSTNKLDSFHVQPYFPEIAASPPTAEQTLELTNLSLDAIPRLYFGFTADHVDNPYSVLSAQLEDGNWYTLRLKNRVFDLSYKDSRYNSSHHHGSIDLPFNANIIYTPAGQYSLALYDTVDGEEVLLASQEFTLTWEGSYCRITGTEQ